MSNPGHQAAFFLNGVAVERERFYAVACDPRRSVAVEACAGAGKTWMLVSRMLRALLDGAEPHEILAITFTKKAAGEMRQRLYEWLQQFALASAQTLEQELCARGLSVQQAVVLCEPLRQLHARLLAHGRSVQIRTFHSWFASLLRSAPYSVLSELGLPTAFELLEDDANARAQVWRPFHARLLDEPQAYASYQSVVLRYGRHATQQALDAALQKRVEFTLADARGVVERCVPSFSALLAGYAGLAHPMQRWLQPTVRARWLACAAALGAEKGVTAQKAARAVILAYDWLDKSEREHDDEQRWQAAFTALRAGFFVAEQDRLTQHLQKFDAAVAIEAELRQLCDAMRQHQGWQHQQHMARLTRILVQEYAALKRQRGWVDMSDVEAAASRLLGDPVLGAWIQERLDARTRHLLIDEFQDTNPLQWQALHAWLSAYGGAGGGPECPSIFLVGDPKQSIYRFRRAEPQVFEAAKSFVLGLGGVLAECDHTRRNAAAVLSEVNRCMGEAQATGTFAGFRAHTTESKWAGGVYALPQIPRPAKTPRLAKGDAEALPEAATPWRDSLNQPRVTPEEGLRTLECRQAAHWVAQQVRHGLAPGEILVLARKRDRLGAMQEELRALGIAAQQPEKLQLGDAPEVQDLVALLDALVSPSQDLSLARALKSPLFGLGDGDLVQLALLQRRRGGCWFDALTQEQALSDPLRKLGSTLLRWKAWLDGLPPHDALEAIFDDGDVLARFMAAAPATERASVLANLQATLWAALQVDGARYATPYALVRSLRAGQVRAPSVADASAVRLLTVHGAKGLEATAVVILDTDAPAPRAQGAGVLIDWPGEAATPLAFVFLSSENHAPPSATHALDVEQAARAREELNALYVAMTRARQCLLVSSVQASTPQAASWWQRLQVGCAAMTADSVWTDLGDRPSEGPAGPVPVNAVLLQTDLELMALPALEVVIAPKSPASPEPSKESEESVIGQAMHRLLERAVCGQTGFTSAESAAVALEFGLDDAQIVLCTAMAQRILNGQGAWAWQADLLDWQANEVSMVLHDGQLVRLDRLVRRRDTGQWWVLDHKTTAHPQREASLVKQLLRYRAAVCSAYPGAEVRSAFLTAQGEFKEIE